MPVSGRSPCYRLEWRRLVSEVDDRVLHDHRFETAVDPHALRGQALRVGAHAFAEEFRVVAPDGVAVWTTLEAIRAWRPEERALPAPDGSSLWREEHVVGCHRAEMVGAVRAAVTLGAARGLFRMATALAILRFAEAASHPVIR